MSKNEEHYRDLVENSLDLICTHDLDGVLLTVNLAAARTLGYEPHEIVNRNLRGLLSPEVHEEFDAYLAAIRGKGAAAGFMRLRTKSGETRIWKYTNTLRTEGIQVPLVRGVAHDVTDILQAQKALRKSEERLRVAAEVGRMYAWEWDPATDSVLRSAECAGILGLEGATGDGFAKDYFNLVHPDDRAKLWGLATSLTPKVPEYRTEYRLIRPDGTLLWLQENGHATFDKAGKMVRLVGMTVDITERKRSEQTLRESEERFRLVANTAPVLIWMAGTDKLCTFFNKGWLDFTGRSMEHELGDGWASGVHQDDLERCLKTYSCAFEARLDFEMEYRLRRFDGKYRWIVDYGVPRFEPDGSFCGYIGSCVDITDRKSTEESLEELSGRLINAQEEERTRIARELHDDFSQRLALQGIGLSQVWKKLPESAVEERAKIQELLKRNQEISSDMHTLSHQLHSSKLDHVGLVPALMGLCDEMGSKYKIEVEFTEREVFSEIPKDVALCFFRIAQEALVNVVKHSGATQAQVELCGANNEISLRIVDAGVGFDPARRTAGAGIGLVSIRERLRLVGGRLSIHSSPTRGTEILAQVPLRVSANKAQVRVDAVEG